jgi:exodeoxyribonuclease-3
MLSILTVNIGAAARSRAETLLRWLVQRPEDAFLLTETSGGAGTAYLLDQFRSAGYTVVHTPDDATDRGAALVSRVALDGTATPDLPVSLPGRVAIATLDTQPRVTLLGIYVPSRDRSIDKTEKKERFISSLLGSLDKMPAESRSALIMGGDYNVISRHHQPRHAGFLPFEFGFLDALGVNGLIDAYDHCSPGVQPYSWIGRTGDGYRYDYFHVGGQLATRIQSCVYLHETREQRLTDHAAVTLTLNVDEVRRLETTELTTPEDMTLF